MNVEEKEDRAALGAIAEKEAYDVIDRALAVAEVVFRNLEPQTFNSRQRTDEEIKVWATKMVAGFEAAESSADKAGQADEKLRTAQAEFLARFYNACHGENLDSTLENIAAALYGQNKNPLTHLREQGEKGRGFFFEVVSRTVPPQSEEVNTVYPELGRPGIERSLAQAVLREAKLTSVGSLRLPNKAELINRRVVAAVGRRAAAGIEFDRASRGWVAKPGANAPAEILTTANATNSRANETLTVPDNLITKGGRVVGFVEAKCWQDYELEAYVEALASRQGAADLVARNLGDRIPAAIINAKRAKRGLPPIDLPPEGINLQLKLQNERDYLAAAVGLNETEKRNLLAVIRLPANIPLPLITQLRGELERRHERVVIEQVRALTADETEIVVNSLIDLNFAAREEERFATTKNKDRNLKARAVALGIRSLEELTKPQVTSILGESDVFLEEALDLEHAQELPASPQPRTRTALVQRLVADYQTTKNSR
jgi:hypothetical protein